MVFGCTEKSRNPLSPSIAGPIEGVSLTVPGLTEPANGALIKVEDQPVRVTFANGASNGERPVLYDLRLATDSEFVQLVHEANEIPANPSGQTSYELPSDLDPETVYYWEVQADDGANASEPSGASSFEVFTPLVIESPQIESPSVGGAQASASTLVIDSPAVEGPASNIEYELQVASDEGFRNVVLSLSGAMSGDAVTIDIASLLGDGTLSGGTRASVRAAAATGLSGNTRYHWRARVTAEGREGRVLGPWSSRGTFETPSDPNALIAPTPLRPVGGGPSVGNPPTLVVRNPSLGQTVGSITIDFQVATDTAFRDIVASPSVAMGSGSTTEVRTRELRVDTLHHWRVRAATRDLTGPWSPVRKFLAPRPSPSGGGDGGGGGGGGGDDDGGGDGGGGTGGSPGDGGDTGGGGSGGGAGDGINLSQVTWLHHDVSGWPKASTITSTSIGSSSMCIDHSKRGKWPTSKAGSTTVEGNPWVFAEVNGRWYAATYEWLRPGQECKGISASNIGPHIKRAPLSSWRPRSGERIGLMVSTPARFGPQGSRNERSNVVMVTWP